MLWIENAADLLFILAHAPAKFALSDLAGRLGIDFPARQRSEFVAHIHHGVTTFALAVIDPKAETHRASLTSNLSDEAVSFIHYRLVYRFEYRTNLSGQQVQFGQK